MKKIILIAFLFSCFIVAKGQQNTLNLMPVPRQLTAMSGKDRITNKFTVSVQANAVDTVLFKAINRAYQTLNRKTGLVFGQQYITPNDKNDLASLVVTVKEEAKAEIGVDESYSVKVSEKQVILSAVTTVGVLRGLHAH